MKNYNTLIELPALNKLRIYETLRFKDFVQNIEKLGIKKHWNLGIVD